MSIPPGNGKVVLISGINGYIASAIGLVLLKKGYTVRGTSRASSGTEALRNGAYKDYQSRFETLAILDMTVPGAFDEAVKGVHAIVHTASPINFSFTTWAQFVPIAVAGATGILESAYKHAGPQLESFVITSSVAAIVDTRKTTYDYSEADWNTYSYDEAKRLDESGAGSPPGMLYQASKVAAEKAIWQFRDEHQPPFAITSVNPGVVIGPPVQPPPSPHLLNETLKPIWDVFSGAPIPPAIGSATYVDIRDVAEVHVWALEQPHEANGQRYLVTNGRGPPQAAADLLRKVYPERRGIIQEGKPGYGYVAGTYGWPEGGTSFEAKKAKDAIASEHPGRKFIGFEQSVLETAKVFERYV